MRTMSKPTIIIGIACLGIQSLFGGLISENASMKDYQTGIEKLTVYTDVAGQITKKL